MLPSSPKIAYVFPLKVGIGGKYRAKKPEYRIKNHIKTVQYVLHKIT